MEMRIEAIKAFEMAMADDLKLKLATFVKLESWKPEDLVHRSELRMFLFIARICELDSKN